MDHPVMSPPEVNAALGGDEPATYVDVRTVAEFSTGHPKGPVVNIPLVFFHPTTKEVFPNQSFLQVVEDSYAKDAVLITGCDNGERAAQAAHKLAEAGYRNVRIMPDGYPGWREHQLPTTQDNRDGISYASLLTRVKRKKGKKKAAH